MWIFLLLLLAPSAEVSADDPAASDYEISAPLTVPQELFVPYGAAVLLEADLPLKASDREAILPGCQRVRLVAVVDNDRSNFHVPSNEASLEIDPVCLECQEGAGGVVRVEGRVTGPELRGEHMKILGLNGDDRFGMHLEGASGLAELNREPGRHETCFEPQRLSEELSEPEG